MVRIGFILPSSDYLVDPFRGDPFAHFHILTILEDYFGAKIKAQLIDLRGLKKEFAVYHIPECDIYLHSVYTLDYEEQVFIVGLLRERYSKAVHIAGGPHANMFPKETLRTFDTIIIGEGEEIIKQAVEDFMSKKLDKVYEFEGGVDINNYPLWRRDYLPASSIAKPNTMTLKNKKGYGRLLGTNVMFSRGCPYRCHFCAIQFIRTNTPGIRYRSPENVSKEIEYLKREYGTQGLILSDEISIPLIKNQAIAHLEAIGRSEVVWRGQCRVDGITHEMARLAHQSGCLAMGLGIESVMQKSLNLINKGIKIEDARRTIGLLKENDIEPRLYIIMGLPGETEDIVDRTWSFIEETKPDLVHLSIFTIRPGTEVYNHPEIFGIEDINTDWGKTMHLRADYKTNRPMLTFKYSPETPWGKSLSNEKIVDNFIELQDRVRKAGLYPGDLWKSEED